MQKRQAKVYQDHKVTEGAMKKSFRKFANDEDVKRVCSDNIDIFRRLMFRALNSTHREGVQRNRDDFSCLLDHSYAYTCAGPPSDLHVFLLVLVLGATSHESTRRHAPTEGS